MALTPASRIQNQVLSRLAGDKFQPFIKLYQAWKDVVGDLLAARSHPFRFQHAILYVAVQNNAWLQELVLKKAQILKKCRTKVPEEIRDIIFMIRS
ncbi:MAG: DUF721 domain-containing protein [Candidatus Syntrophosphaera sp.]|nr:DUF721 domain-containing protein [Candidatus Syntrophosphaera sp.]